LYLENSLKSVGEMSFSKFACKNMKHFENDISPTLFKEFSRYKGEEYQI